MDHVEMNTTDENKSGSIRKKSSFVSDGSYQLFHITNQSKEDGDNRSNNNIDQLIDKRNNKFQKKSLKITNRNGLKQFLFPYKTTCESSSIEAKTPPLSRHQPNESSQSVICREPTSVKLLKKNKQHVKRENMTNWSKSNVIDETIAQNILLVRANKFELTSRKQVLIRSHPEIQRSFHRRRKRFIVACGTVLIALSVIIIIIIYVIIMTIKHKTKINQLHFNNSPR